MAAPAPATPDAQAEADADAQPAAAQDDEQRLLDLRDRAIETFETSARDAQGQERVLAAWRELEAAARAVREAHPLAAFAQIKAAASLLRPWSQQGGTGRGGSRTGRAAG